jgi:hypothetical protein
MGFMSSYKHLEKLCGEVMNDERKVSAYIDEMVQTPQGAGRVAGWNEDLKRLKHYRWVRNQIVHEPDCTEENMCDPEDVRWLKDFYDRMRGGLVATTSALNPDNWASTMEPYLQDGKDLLVLSVSSGISATSALFWAPIPVPAYWDCFIWAPAGKQKIIAYTLIDNFPQQ